MLDGEYTTPLVAGYYYTYPIGFFDLTGVHVTDQSVFDAPERQAFRAPGYPAYLAVLGGGGKGVPRELALIGQALLFGLGTLLLAFTVRDWWGPGVGLASAAVYALDPFSKHYVTILLSEQLAAFLVLAGVFAYTRAVRSRHLGWWAATGALAGVAHARPRGLRLHRPPRDRGSAAAARGTAARRRGGARLRGAAARPLARLDEPHDGPRRLRQLGAGLQPARRRARRGLRPDARRTSPRTRRSSATSSSRTGTHRHASSCSAIPRRTRATSRARTRTCARARSRCTATGSATSRSRCSGRTSTARSFSGRRTRTGTSRPAPRSSSCKRSTSSCSRWRSSASCSRYAAAAPPRGVAIFLLVYTVVIATHHTEARFAMPVRGLYLALMTFGALALLERLPAWRRRAGTSPARTAPSPDFRPTS